MRACSTNRQSAFASRICSTVRQSTSSSRGEQTTYARHCARETATFSRFRESRKSSPRGTSSPLERRHRVEDDRRLAALELVDRADLDAGGQPLAQQPHLRVVRRDDHHVGRARAAARSALVTERLPDEPLDLGARSRPPPRSDSTRLPSCSTGEPADADAVGGRPLGALAGSSRAGPRRTRPRRTGRPPGASAASARGRCPRPPGSSRARRGGARARDAPEPARMHALRDLGELERVAEQDEPPRGGAAGERVGEARSGRPRRRRACRARRRAPRARRARRCRRPAAPPGRGRRR